MWYSEKYSKLCRQDKQTTSTHSADGIHLLISVWMLQNKHTHTHAHTSIFGMCVRVNQEFLPSQSGPICWKLTCTLTPLRVTLSEHRNTKSGKRKTLTYFGCFLMHLILKVLLSSSGCSISPPLNTIRSWYSNGLVFSAHATSWYSYEAYRGKGQQVLAHQVMDCLTGTTGLCFCQRLCPFLHSTCVYNNNTTLFRLVRLEMHVLNFRQIK